MKIYNSRLGGNPRGLIIDNLLNRSWSEPAAWDAKAFKSSRRRYMQIFKVRARGYRSSYFLAACRRSRIPGCATVICFASCKTRGTKGERGWGIKRKKGEDWVETRGRVDEAKEWNEWPPSGETGLGGRCTQAWPRARRGSRNEFEWKETTKDGGVFVFAYLLRMPMIFSLA